MDTTGRAQLPRPKLGGRQRHHTTWAMIFQLDVGDHCQRTIRGLHMVLVALIRQGFARKRLCLDLSGNRPASSVPVPREDRAPASENLIGDWDRTGGSDRSGSQSGARRPPPGQGYYYRSYEERVRIHPGLNRRPRSTVSDQGPPLRPEYRDDYQQPPHHRGRQPSIDSTEQNAKRSAHARRSMPPSSRYLSARTEEDSNVGRERITITRGNVQSVRPSSFGESSPGTWRGRPSRRTSTHRPPSPRGRQRASESNDEIVILFRSPSPAPTRIGRAKGGKFKYPRLDRQKHEFRLLQLFPGSDEARIKCRVATYQLEDYHSYVALSYTWGDTEERMDITLNNTKEDFQFPIGPNLYHALRRLRHPTHPVMIWADALCINQDDEDERGHQVRHMTSIYWGAREVAIWLVLEGEDSDFAMALLQEVYDNRASPEYIRVMINTRSLKTAFLALVRLFERPYWRRLWVVQEVICARVKTVYCGQRKLEWDAFASVSGIFDRHATEINKSFTHGKKGPDGGRWLLSKNDRTVKDVLLKGGPAEIASLDRGLQGPESLMEALVACRSKMGSRPADKVFAVLGFLPRSVRGAFQVDYNRTIRSIYTDVAQYLIEKTHRLDICHAVFYPDTHNIHNLPSWVPDWSQSLWIHVPIDPVGEMAPFGAPFEASGSIQAAGEYKPVLLPGRRQLEIHAIPLGTIDEKGFALGVYAGGLHDGLPALAGPAPQLQALPPRGRARKG